jgi:hypothetical protein
MLLTSYIMTNRQILYCNIVKNESTLKPLQMVHKNFSHYMQKQFCFQSLWRSNLLFRNVLIYTTLLIYFIVFT